MPQIGIGLGMLISGLASGGAAVYGAQKMSSASNKAAKLQTDAATRAAEIQDKANREAMDYAKQVEAQHQKNFETTQALNLDQYNQREARVTPYRNLGDQGVTLLSGLVRPGSGSDFLPRAPNTLNTLVGGGR